MAVENLNHILQQNINNKDLKGMKDMRIKYFGENKERGWGRVAIIRFTDDEFDLYKYIENYEHTYGDSSRMFACGGLVGVERNEKGVWINESYISVDNFDDFNDLKANYKEAKKEFNSLKKQATETKPETATDSETADQGETAEKKMDDVLFETLIRNAKAFPPCDFPGATKLLNICQQMNKTQLSDFCKILIEKGIFTYEYGQIVTTKGRLLICPVSDMARGA